MSIQSKMSVMKVFDFLISGHVLRLFWPNLNMNDSKRHSSFQELDHKEFFLQKTGKSKSF